MMNRTAKDNPAKKVRLPAADRLTESRCSPQNVEEIIRVRMFGNKNLHLFLKSFSSPFYPIQPLLWVVAQFEISLVKV